MKIRFKNRNGGNYTVDLYGQSETEVRNTFSHMRRNDASPVSNAQALATIGGYFDPLLILGEYSQITFTDWMNALPSPFGATAVGKRTLESTTDATNASRGSTELPNLLSSLEVTQIPVLSPSGDLVFDFRDVAGSTGGRIPGLEGVYDAAIKMAIQRVFDLYQENIYVGADGARGVLNNISTKIALEAGTGLDDASSAQDVVDLIYKYINIFQNTTNSSVYPDTVILPTILQTIFQKPRVENNLLFVSVSDAITTVQYQGKTLKIVFARQLNTIGTVPNRSRMYICREQDQQYYVGMEPTLLGDRSRFQGLSDSVPILGEQSPGFNTIPGAGLFVDGIVAAGLLPLSFSQVQLFSEDEAIKEAEKIAKADKAKAAKEKFNPKEQKADASETKGATTGGEGK